MKQLYPNKKIPSVAALNGQERIELKKDKLYEQYKDAQNEAQTYQCCVKIYSGSLILSKQSSKLKKENILYKIFIISLTYRP